MSLRDEIEHYDRVGVLPGTGETDFWDETVFPKVIRERERELILSHVQKVSPKRVLDFGCGTGWVSKLLSSNGHHVVGIDVSSHLVKSAISSPSQNSQFVVGDCMSLPFKDSTFDVIIGIGILHHLTPEKGLSECLRVAAGGATLLLMEPNKLSPIAAFGRKALPLNIHTKGEKPFTPWQLTKALREGGWAIEKTSYLFPFSFLLSYLLRQTRGRVNRFFKALIPINMVALLERLMEAIPFLNRLNWVLVTVARKTVG